MVGSQCPGNDMQVYSQGVEATAGPGNAVQDRSQRVEATEIADNHEKLSERVVRFSEVYILILQV